MACAGTFATSRRVNLSICDIGLIRAAHSGLMGRPVPVQALANTYGASMADIREIVSATAQTIRATPTCNNEGWPLGSCSDRSKRIIRDVADRFQISVSRMGKCGRKDKAAFAARAEAMFLMHEAGSSILSIATIFNRDHAIVSTNVSRHRKSLVKAAQKETPKGETQAIVERLAQPYGITLQQIIGPSTLRPIAVVRQMAMAELSEMKPDHTLAMLSDIFGGRHHTTIMHGVQLHKNRMAIVEFLKLCNPEGGPE